MGLLLVVAGFLAGISVGATAIGGGILVVPALMAVGLRPTEAVGTALAINFATRLIAAFQHHRQRTVHYGWVGAIALGSLPTAVLTIMLIGSIKSNLSVELLDLIVKKATGTMLVILSILGIVSEVTHRRKFKGLTSLKLDWKGRLASLLAGSFTGASVPLTSMGSGGIIVAFLSACTSLEPSVVVGTSIVHGIFLTSVSLLGHVLIGKLNLPAIALFLAGSLPGALLGSWFSLLVPKRALRLTLLAFVFAIGVRALV